MLSLEKYTGLPIEMRDDFSLTFGGNLEAVEPKIKEFSSIRNYLKNPLSTYWRRDVYHIYCDIALPEHREKIKSYGLAYDITVIPPGKIGDEFVKTAGHYHQYKTGTNVRYPEVCEVVYGRAFLILQSASSDLERLEDIYIVEVKRGQKVLVPPNFGYVSVDPTEDVLILASWRKAGIEDIFEPYEARAGAAYYVVETERLSSGGKTAAEYKFVPNLNYNLVPPYREARPRELPKYDLLSALPMYFTGTREIETLDFLVHPENYLDELVPEKLFK